MLPGQPSPESSSFGAQGAITPASGKSSSEAFRCGPPVVPTKMEGLQSAGFGFLEMSLGRGVVACPKTEAVGFNGHRAVALPDDGGFQDVGGGGLALGQSLLDAQGARPIPGQKRPALPGHPFPESSSFGAQRALTPASEKSSS